MEENSCLLITPSLLCFLTLLNAVHIAGKVIAILKICINIYFDLRFKINHLTFVKVLLVTDELHFHKLIGWFVFSLLVQ